METYRANATLGVGVVDLIVASGTKQVDIESTLELEENLNLVSRLMPLQSSHVQSGATGSSSTADKDEKNKDSEEKEQEGQNQDTEKNPNKDVQKDENNPGKNSDEVQDSDKE